LINIFVGYFMTASPLTPCEFVGYFMTASSFTSCEQMVLLLSQHTQWRAFVLAKEIATWETFATSVGVTNGLLKDQHE
jgi:hypothetical protein